MKFLVVDDSITMRRIISNLLQEIGHENIVEAGDGMDAMNKLEGVDVILTDWNMPHMNGLQFVQKIRSEPFYKDIPIVMITTESGKADVVTAIQSGVNHYLVKPFTKQSLEEKIHHVMKKS